MSGPETGRDQNRLQQAPCQIRRRSVTLAGTVGWFDYGDDWMHQINVVNIEDAPARGRFPKITTRVGKSPPQYPDIDE